MNAAELVTLLKIKLSSLVRVTGGGLGFVERIALHPSGGPIFRVVRCTWPGTWFWSYEVKRVMQETLRDHLMKIGAEPTFTKHISDDAVKSLREFRELDWADLNARDPGDAKQLLTVYGNAIYAVDFLEGVAGHLTSKGNPQIDDQLNYASTKIVLAGKMLSGAFLLHLRENKWNENACLIVQRTALESLGEAAAMILDPRCVEIWRAGDRIDGNVGMIALGRLLRARNPAISDPWRVYGWMSQFVHMSIMAAMQSHASSSLQLSHSDGYASIAYVSWACAVLTEIVLERTDLSEWPERWPSPLPWEQPWDQKPIVESWHKNDSG